MSKKGHWKFGVPGNVILQKKHCIYIGTVYIYISKRGLSGHYNWILRTLCNNASWNST